MPDVNPDILKWARETAGLSLEEAAATAAINPARGKSGPERLAELEQGKRAPSRPQLLKLAKAYRRSLLVFYLDTPPARGDRGQDFRTLPGAPSPHLDAWVDALIRDIKGRQSLVRALLEDDEAETRTYIGSATPNDRIADFARHITQETGFILSEYRHQRDVAAAFSYLRERVESAGIFVILIGDLGSHHTAIPVETFRGFAIADQIAPFVVVNDRDAKPAWSFTVFHEVAHLFLGQTGISGEESTSHAERYCNDVAAEMLFPASELLGFPQLPRSLPDAVSTITKFADERKISRAMVAYRLFRTGRIDEMRWRNLDQQFKPEDKDKRPDPDDASSGGGPSYYVVRRHRLGQALVSLVSRSLQDGAISYTRAAQVLGVKPRNVEPLLRTTPSAGGV